MSSPHWRRVQVRWRLTRLSPESPTLLLPKNKLPPGIGLGGSATTQAPVQLLCRRSKRRSQGILHWATRAQAKPRRRAAGASLVGEHAPRSLDAGLAPQRHHHLCPDPSGRPVRREKEDILRDLRNYRAAETPTGVHLGDQGLTGLRGTSDPSGPSVAATETLALSLGPANAPWTMTSSLPRNVRRESWGQFWIVSPGVHRAT